MAAHRVEYNLSDGVTAEELDEKLIGEFYRSQKAFQKGFVRFQPYNQVMPRVYAKHEKALKDFRVREDDVWIASFPKSGTTWTEEMVWCLMNNMDYEAAKKTTLDERIPFVEMAAIWSPDSVEPGEAENSIKQANEMKGQRILKTHLSVDMLPKQVMEKKAKVIYVARNPRDVCASYYNHWQIFEGFHGTFDTFVDAFLNDVCGYYTPYFKNVLDFWELQKTSENILFIFYEDMKRDLPAVIRKVSSFLGAPIAEVAVGELASHLSFDKMKSNPSVNKQEWVKIANEIYNKKSEESAFLRKGQSGNWRKKLSEEQIKRFEDWERRWLATSDLKFNYD